MSAIPLFCLSWIGFMYSSSLSMTVRNKLPFTWVISRETPLTVQWGYCTIIYFRDHSLGMLLHHHSGALKPHLIQVRCQFLFLRECTAWVVGRMMAEPTFPVCLGWCFICAQLLSPVWLCGLRDWSPPGSAAHGIFQARILEWVAISSSRGSFQPRDWNCLSWIFCTTSATWEAQCFIYIISKILCIIQEGKCYILISQKKRS